MPAGGGTAFAVPVVGATFRWPVKSAVPGGGVVQQVVHSVFFTVVSVVATLLTVGLTGVIILLVTDSDTPHADTRHQH
jgi:hypothetical protein